MNWLQDNLQIIATLGSALAVYFALRSAATKDINRLESEMKEMNSELKSIDRRLTRLEGRFEERGYWESQKVIELRREGEKK